MSAEEKCVRVWDLPTRLFQHETGMGSVYTRDRLPVELVWHEEYEKVSHAFAREKQIQNWSRAKRLALVEGDYEALPALAKKDFSRRRPPQQVVD